MRFRDMLKRLLKLKRDTMECTQQIERVQAERQKVVEPLRRKSEQRRRESSHPLVSNGQSS